MKIESAKIRLGDLVIAGEGQTFSLQISSNSEVIILVIAQGSPLDFDIV